jgi:hypothetical protein
LISIAKSPHPSPSAGRAFHLLIFGYKKALAKEGGSILSFTMVSRALNGYDDVNEETRKRKSKKSRWSFLTAQMLLPEVSSPRKRAPSALLSQILTALERKMPSLMKCFAELMTVRVN